MEMKHETKIGIICIVFCSLLLLVAFYVIRYEDLKAQRTANASSNIEGTDSDDRFEIEYTQRISNCQLTHHLKVMGLRLPCSSLANSYILSV